MNWTPEQLREVQKRLERNRHHAQNLSLQKATDQQLLEAYAETGSIWKTAERFGMCGQSVLERLKDTGILHRSSFSKEQEKLILDFYQKGFRRGELKLFCNQNALLITSVSRFARLNGLTDQKRQAQPEFGAAVSIRAKQWYAEHEHPRGMLGKKHSEATLARLSETSIAAAKNRTPDQESARILKTLKTKAANGTLIQPRRASWKQGWHVIGTRRIFFRSRWEVNYACYLEFLKLAGEVRAWDYEPETFWFEKIRRGVRCYIPDFKVTFTNGAVEFHEVKGWMDPRSITKIKRMRIYHPKVKLVLITKDWFKTHKNLAKSIPGWQSCR